MSERARFILRMKFYTESEPWPPRNFAQHDYFCDLLRRTAVDLIGFGA